MRKFVSTLVFFLFLFIAFVGYGQAKFETVTGTVTKVTGMIVEMGSNDINFVAITLKEFPQKEFRLSRADATKMGIYKVTQKGGVTHKEVTKDLEGKKVEITFKRANTGENVIISLKPVP
jgi:hypothetical protein